MILIPLPLIFYIKNRFNGRNYTGWSFEEGKSTTGREVMTNLRRIKWPPNDKIDFSNPTV
jgi:hypothetical protein